MYALTAQRFGVDWAAASTTEPILTPRICRTKPSITTSKRRRGSRGNRRRPTATLPQLGFIHEDSGQSFVLDIADLFRDQVTVPCAFKAVSIGRKRPGDSFERIVRRVTGETLKRDGVISTMIDRIKMLFERPEGESEPPRRGRPPGRPSKAKAREQEVAGDSEDSNADDSGGDA